MCVKLYAQIIAYIVYVILTLIAHIIQDEFHYMGGIAMDYYKIGQQIRKIRKAHGLSQEELAERINISTTHMSHIETGNTKLSLSVFVDIASALEVRADDLLGNHSVATTSSALEEIAGIIERCSAQEAKIIVDIAKAAKLSMDKYL